MEVTLSALVLLLVLLVVVVVESERPSDHAIDECWNNQFGEKEKSEPVQSIKGLNSTKTLYVIPEQGFEGVILEATKGNEVHHATFPFSEQCYDGSGSRWNELRVDVKPPLSDTDPGGIVEVRIGECAAACSWSVLNSESTVTIVSHGKLKWKHLLNKQTCDINQATVKQASNEGSCTDLSFKAKTPPPPPPTPTTITTAPPSTTTAAPPANAAAATATAPGSSGSSGAVLVLERVSYVLIVVVVVVVVGVVGMLVTKLLRLPPPPRLEVVPLPALPGGARGTAAAAAAAAAAARGQEEAQIIVNELYEPTTSRADHHHHHHHPPAARHDSVHSVINQNYHH